MKKVLFVLIHQTFQKWGFNALFSHFCQMVAMETMTVMKILILTFGEYSQVVQWCKVWSWSDKGRKCYQDLKFSNFLFLTTLMGKIEKKIVNSRAHWFLISLFSVCFSENCLANASFLVSSGYVFLDSNTLPLTVLKKSWNTPFQKFVGNKGYCC